jgi:8-oxo-dGTP diphosphatase
MPAPVTPRVAADVLIELVDFPGRPIVLIARRHPPLGWAIPGGFVDIGETVEAGAAREAREETKLDVRLVQLLGCYSDPARDARGHTVSLVYVAEARGRPVAGDDAGEVTICLPAAPPQPLVFDHALILSDYLAWREHGVLPRPRANPLNSRL